MGKIVTVAKKGALGPGRGMVVEAEGKQIALFNCDGELHAIDNVCCHKGGPLGEGELEGKIVTCPWHGWQYDVTTGVCTFNPAAQVAKYRVEVVGDEVKVEI